jgi:hypothetical protein
MSSAIIPTISNLYSQFNPIAAVPNCSLWLDAADPSTFTLSGSNVTQWNDKSGNGRNATVFSASPTRGSNSVIFNGSNQGLQTSLSASDATESGFVMVTLNNFSAVNTLLGSANGNGGRQFRVFNTIQTIKQGVSNILTTGTNLSNGQSLLSYVSNLSSSTITHFSRGATYATGTSVAYDALRTTSIGCRFGSTEFLNGDIHEILVFSRALTTFEREQIEGYLAWKWYYQINLSGTHSFFNIPPVVRDFIPTDILTPTFWLDAADPTSMTLSGSTVTTWRDKSGNGFSGTSVGSPQWTTVDGYPAITFDGSTQYFNFGDVADLGANQLNIFVVSKFNTTANGTLVAKSLAGSTDFRYALIRDSGDIRPLLDTTFAAGQRVADSNTSRRILSWEWDRTTNELLQNGTSIVSGTFTGAVSFNSTYLLLVGAYNNNTGGVPPGGLYLNGSINEILFYFMTLTNAQIQRIEGYLAQKWGLQKSLPTTHPFYSVFPKTVAFNPRQISGCTLWLDATDISTITLSGSNVTQWSDKSGQLYHFSQATPGNQPTYSSTGFGNRGSIVFDGIGSYLFSTTFGGLFGGLNTPLSFFCVMRWTSKTSPAIQCLFNIYTGTSTNGFHGIYFDQGAAPNAWQHIRRSAAGTTVTVSSANIISSGVSYVHSQIFPGTTVTGFTNGTSVLSGNMNVATLGTNTTIGCIGILYRSIIQYPLNGQVGEVLVYNRAVTTEERRQIEGYLAWKWGAQSSFPNTYPYRYVNPI